MVEGEHSQSEEMPRPIEEWMHPDSSRMATARTESLVATVGETYVGVCSEAG